jgi:hypothetical protein
VFGVVTAVLLGCWGVLAFVPDPGSALPTATATEEAGTYHVMTLEDIPVGQTKAEALAREQNLELRMLQLVPVADAIREVVGPGMSEQQLIQVAAQAITLCPTKAKAAGTLIANGVPSTDVTAVIEAACPTL